MKSTIVMTPMMCLCLGLAAVPAMADTGGIYLRQDQGASVELSNVPADANYELIIASPVLATDRPHPAAATALSAGMPTGAGRVPLANAEPAPPAAPVPEADNRVLDPPQTTARGYLDTLLRMRGRDPATIHGTGEQPTKK